MGTVVHRNIVKCDGPETLSVVASQAPVDERTGSIAPVAGRIRAVTGRFQAVGHCLAARWAREHAASRSCRRGTQIEES
jgi:hypothetical protein